MTLKFIHPTLAQVLRVASIALTLADLFLGYASTIQTLPFVPPAAAMYWPVLLATAAFLHQAASTFGVTPDAALAATLHADALQAARIAGAVAAAKEMLAQGPTATAPVPTAGSGVSAP